LYRGLREREPTRVKCINLKLPKALMVMGHVEIIAYSTTHGNVAQPYVHVFAKGSRPLLCAGPRKGQLFLIGNRYLATSLGVVDLSPTGRKLRETARAKKIQNALAKAMTE
jgi:hypothetical protein